MGGGTRDRDDLLFWSTLAGERDEWTTTTDLNGRVASRTTRRVPVVPPAQIANLPAGRVLVIRRALPPVLGRARMAWHRLDVAAHFRPDALTVRTRILLIRTWLLAKLWLAEHAARLTGAVLAMWAAAPTAGALTPSWRGWAALATAAAIGWLAVALLAAARSRSGGGWCGASSSRCGRGCARPGRGCGCASPATRARSRPTRPSTPPPGSMPVRDDDDEKPGQP